MPNKYGFLRLLADEGWGQSLSHPFVWIDEKSLLNENFYVKQKI